MLAILSLIVVVIVSLVVVRVATIALTLTGVSSEMARFQARSAFTGAGFTTAESEQMVTHPVRRRIIMLLMLLGNAGIVTAASTLILSFTGAGDDGWFNSIWARLGLLAIALVALVAVAHSRWVDRTMSRAIKWSLARWTRLEVRDYSSLLHLTDDYVVTELRVGEGDWLAGRSLAQLSLSREGVLVLGIERSQGGFLGAPRGGVRVRAADTLLLYGRAASFEDLDERPVGPEGNRRHVQAVGRHRDLERARNVDADDDEDGDEDSAELAAAEVAALAESSPSEARRRRRQEAESAAGSTGSAGSDGRA